MRLSIEIREPFIIFEIIYCISLVFYAKKLLNIQFVEVMWDSLQIIGVYWSTY